MNRYISEKIKRLDEYAPESGYYRILMNANESPYPLPTAVIERIKTALDSFEFNRYPDMTAHELIYEYSKVINIAPENIVAGNGSDELISIICNSFLSRGDAVLTLAPDFSMYAFYSGLIEAKVITYKKPDGWKIDFSELMDIIKRENIKLVIFSNPSNPTGAVYSRREILNFVRSIDCLAVIDEAYMDFCTEDYSVLSHSVALENLIVLKTLSKAYGLAALRAGFAISTKEIISGIKKVKSPYNMNAMTQLIAKQVLCENTEMKKLNLKIIKNTAVLYDELSKLSESGGYTINKTYTNFVLLRFNQAERAEQIFKKLMKSGILIRHPSAPTLRITAGNDEENNEFINEFRRLIAYK